MIQRKKLGEIANISAGQGAPQGAENYSEEGTPFVKAGDLFYLVNGERECDIQKVSEEVAKNHRLKLYPKGTVLFAKSGMSCMKGYVYATNAECYVVSHLACIMPFDVDSKYLKYYFEYHKPNQLVKDASYPSISLADIAEMPINVFDDQTEAKIVDNLDAVNSLIAKSKEELGLLDNIVKSRFVEMFGDPMTNSKGYPCYTVGDIIEFQGGSQPDKKYFEYVPSKDNIRLIQIRDYKNDKYITYIPRAMAKRFCTADDIMIGRYGPPIFQILKGIEGSFNVALMKATPKQGNREFIREFLKQDCLLEYLEGLSQRTAGQDGIQMDKLKAYPFPYPPIALQDRFAAFVAEVDKSKLAVKQSLEKLETLKKSLMQQYFG